MNVHSITHGPTLSRGIVGCDFFGITFISDRLGEEIAVRQKGQRENVSEHLIRRKIIKDITMCENFPFQSEYQLTHEKIIRRIQSSTSAARIVIYFYDSHNSHKPDIHISVHSSGCQNIPIKAPLDGTVYLNSRSKLFQRNVSSNNQVEKNYPYFSSGLKEILKWFHLEQAIQQNTVASYTLQTASFCLFRIDNKSIAFVC